jgi:phosphopantothenoylcysteine decarboxylase/phosphopantothenate--cysteine ligase
VVTNRASGLLGTEIARVMTSAGADTKLVAGEVTVPLPPGAIQVRTAEEMASTVLKLLPEVKILIMCAAVADYQPLQSSKTKIHEEQIDVRFQRTKDILKLVSTVPHRPLTIGFSQDDTITRARQKLREKKLDLIVANPVQTAGALTIRPTVIFPSGRSRRFPEMSKSEFAIELVKIIADLYHKKEKDINRNVR